jgi:hypothetical protein
MPKDDAQMQFAVENAYAFDRLVESDGWGALGMKAVEDIKEKQEALLDGKITIEQVRFIQGYIAGIKALMTFPALMVEAANLSEDDEKERVQTRRQVSKLVT